MINMTSHPNQQSLQMTDQTEVVDWISGSTRSHRAGFLLSVAISETMNPKAGTPYHFQPVAESLRITDHYGYTRNLYIM